MDYLDLTTPRGNSAKACAEYEERAKELSFQKTLKEENKVILLEQCLKSIAEIGKDLERTQRKLEEEKKARLYTEKENRKRNTIFSIFSIAIALFSLISSIIIGFLS